MSAICPDVRARIEGATLTELEANLREVIAMLSESDA
jgi:hypothetical protein